MITIADVVAQVRADDAKVFAANIIDDIRAAVRAEFARGE